MVIWSELIGKKIVGFRGLRRQKKYAVGTFVPVTYILFDDGKTYIKLDEQNSYDYHDCSASARNIGLHEDASQWQRLYDLEGVEESDSKTNYPF